MPRSAAARPLRPATRAAPGAAAPSAAAQRPGRCRRVGRLAGVVAALPMLLACATLPTAPAVTPITALAQDSRVQFIVLHYTSETLADSLRILSTQQVSAHYLIGDQDPPVVYALVPEDRRAWHAGDSAWQGHTALNAASIGIEIVNPGRQRLADGSQAFAPYAPAQIDALIALLRGIVARHGVRADRIVGHSDIAPQRKDDPGPAMPWHRLADAGLITWPDAATVAALLVRHQAQPPDTAWLQATLARIGYAVPASGQLDSATQRVLAAFQMKYRPRLHDGLPDAETTALVQAVADLAATTR